MSGGIETLSLKEDDVQKFLAASSHLGEKDLDWQMEQYVHDKTPDGYCVFNVNKTWEKLLLAARIIAAIDHPSDVFAISSRPVGQRAVLKFASHTGAQAIAGRFTPGTFTNQIQTAFREPRLLILCDPRSDHQPIREASYVNIPVVAFCNSNSPLKLVDVAIPCNTNSKESVGLMWWMLAREVLRLKGKIARSRPWEVMPDLFFFRDQEDQEKEEQEKQLLASNTLREADNQLQYGGAVQPDWQEQDWQNEMAPMGDQFAQSVPGITQPAPASVQAPFTGGQAPSADNWGGTHDASW